MINKGFKHVKKNRSLFPDVFNQAVRFDGLYHLSGNSSTQGVILVGLGIFKG